MNYKILTIYEPWATLLVHGIKKIETRPSKTNWTIDPDDIFGNNIRGKYLIHAAKRWTKEQGNLTMKDSFRGELLRLGFRDEYVNGIGGSIGRREIKFPYLGHIIGAIEIIKCLKIPQLASDSYDEIYIGNNGSFQISFKEYSFGDYKAGRYAWVTKNPRLLKNPIPYKGGQGYYQNFKGDKNQLIFL